MTNENRNNGASPQPVILTPADFADTGQWRLVVHVAADGMGAVLRHVSDTSRPAVRLFDDRWEPLEGRALLERIEQAVYEHPGILDDYATEIIVSTPRTTWVPTELLADGSFTEEQVFSEVFPGEKEVMADRVGEATALFSLADGFDAFMARTLPGSRIRSHLAVLAEKVLDRVFEDSLDLCLFLHKESVQLVAVKGRRLLCASEHPAGSLEEVAALVDAAVHAWVDDPDMLEYDVDNDDVFPDLCLVNLLDFSGRGPQEISARVGKRCRRIDMFAHRRLPMELTGSGLPAATALAVFKEIDLEVDWSYLEDPDYVYNSRRRHEDY